MFFRITILSIATFGMTTVVIAQSIEAPTYRVGESWVYAVKNRSVADCSGSAKAEDKETQTIIEINDAGYVAEITLAAEARTYKSKLAKNLSTTDVRDGKQIVFDALNFPLKTGNTWDTTRSSGNVVTKLTCQQEEPEKMKVGADDFQVVPISCKGRWTNVASGGTNQATYKFWYSADIGNFVRRTIFTYYSGGKCVDVDARLESFKKVIN